MLLLHGGNAESQEVAGRLTAMPNKGLLSPFIPYWKRAEKPHAEPLRR
jgi:hypothetical protein